jgi:hypothetical protein
MEVSLGFLGAAIQRDPNVMNIPASIDIESAICEYIKAILASEITNDPESLGYAGKSDQEVADLLNAPYYRLHSGVRRGAIEVQAGSIPGAYLAGPRDTTWGRIVLLTADIAKFRSALDINDPAHHYTLRFTNTTTTVALRGLRRPIARVDDNALVVSEPLPAAPVSGDRIRIGHYMEQPSRWAVLKVCIPHAPPEIIASDVEAARS